MVVNRHARMSAMPLRPHPEHPNLFQDAAGRPVRLAGSHHWDVLVDNAERPGSFDFEGYIDRLQSWGHNFIRFWAHEAWTHDLHPSLSPGRAPTAPCST